MSSTVQRANRISVYDGRVRIFAKLAPSIAMAVLVLPISAAAQNAKSASIPDCGSLAGQVLRCAKFGFAYKVPFGWVDRTAEMRQEAPSESTSQPAEGGGSSEQLLKPGASAGRLLLAVFERPPEVGGAGFDPAVIIMVERAADYPNVKTAADYFGPLADIAEQRGLKMEDGPYAFSVGTKRLVRGDFSGGSEKAPVRQSSLVTLEKGYIVSFTFLRGSEDEIDDLIRNLTFTAGVRQKSPSK